MRPLLAALLFSTLGAGGLHAAQAGKDKQPAKADDTALAADEKAADDIRDLLRAGRPDEAARAARALVAELTQRRGAEHQETLRARYLLASAWVDQGQNAEAAEELRVLIPEFTRVLGAEHAETLGCRIKRLYCLAAQGRHQEAADEYRSSLIPICSACSARKSAALW